MLQAYDGTYPPNHVRLSEESFQQVLKVLRLGWRPFVTPTSSALGSPNTPFHEELQRTAEDTPTRIQHRSFSSEHSPLLPLYEQGTRLSTRGRIVSRPSTPSIFRQSRNDQSSKSSQILIVILLLISYICILYGGYHLGKLLSRPLWSRFDWKRSRESTLKLDPKSPKGKGKEMKRIALLFHAKDHTKPPIQKKAFQDVKYLGLHIPSFRINSITISGHNIFYPRSSESPIGYPHLTACIRHILPNNTIPALNWAPS